MTFPEQPTPSSETSFERRGDLSGRQQVQRHNDLFFPPITQPQSTVLKTIGDALLALFAEPAQVEGILMVSVTDTPQAVEIFARFVDVETSVVLAAEDVCGEDLTLHALRTFAESLAVMFRRRLPLVEGVMVKAEGRQVFVDLGEKQAIRKYMKLLLFREREPFKPP